jgi:hypothetical protein
MGAEGVVVHAVGHEIGMRKSLHNLFHEMPPFYPNPKQGTRALSKNAHMSAPCRRSRTSIILRLYCVPSSPLAVAFALKWSCLSIGIASPLNSELSSLAEMSQPK